MKALAIRLDRWKIYYGWVIVVVVFLASLGGAGVGGYVFTIMILPLQEDLGTSRAGIVAAQTIASICMALAAPVVGRLVDRFGPRTLMTVGGVAEGFLLLILSRITSLWQLYLFYGVGSALARAESSNVVALTALSNWFIKKRGRAIAISMIGISVAGGIMVPLAQMINSVYGWRTTWVLMAFIAWSLVALPSWIFMRRRPEDMGLRPDGAGESPGLSEAEQGQGIQPEQSEAYWNPKAALRTKAFWLLSITTFLWGLATIGMWINLPTYYMDQGFSPQVAASAMGVYAFATGGARLFWGFLVEGIQPRYCFGIALLASALGLFMILNINGQPMLMGVSAYQGFIVGGGLVITGVIWPDYFGRVHIGSIRGMAQPFQSIGSAGGPLFAAWLFDVFGSYQLPFVIFIVCFLVALAIVLYAKSPGSPQEHQGGVA